MRLALALALVLASLGPGAVRAQSLEVPPASRPALWPWALVAVGGAMLVASAVTGGLALERQASLDRICSPHSCPPSAEASQAEGRALAFSTDALWAGGLVLLGLGTLLLLALPAEPVGAVAACSADGCALLARGVF